MKNIEEFLEATLSQTGWNITKPDQGKSKESYIAERFREKVFVKLDVSTRALNTLSKIGVAPKVLASGDQNGIAFVVQEYMEGTHPDEIWFRVYIRVVARLIKSYHSNQKLAKELSETHTLNYKIHINKELDFLEQYLGMVNSPVLDKEEIKAQIQHLKDSADSLTQTKLVPIHADPNPANFIISHNKVYMVDWDDITLSDEMTDISLLLWKYVPNDAWNDFFDEYGVSFEKVEKRFYWWLSRGSLIIALWFIEQGDEKSAKDYLKDFNSAVVKLLS